jgi:hypothetical protein
LSMIKKYWLRRLKSFSNKATSKVWGVWWLEAK